MEANGFVADFAGVFLNTEVAEGIEKRRGSGERGDGDGLNEVGWATPSRLRASIGNGSRGFDYCQGTVLSIDHSN